MEGARVEASPEPEQPDALRRRLVAASVATSIAPLPVGAAPHGARPLWPVVETDVEVKTLHGICDAALFHPERGSHAGAILWTDVFGLRPSMRAMARRLASYGFVVVVPNPYYRLGRAPYFETAVHFDFKSQSNRAHLNTLVTSIRAEGAVEHDAVALVAYLDALPQADHRCKIGTFGYCSGGPLVVRTAAEVPDRIGAGAVFHGGALVTKRPDSPHLLAPRIKARMYFGIAIDDDAKYPYDRHWIHESFVHAHVPTQVDVYSGRHGWCVPDLPTDEAGPYYDAAEAERAWGALVRLFQQSLPPA